MANTTGAKPQPPSRISLHPLNDFDGESLEVGHDYDAIHFAEQDFSGQDASDARFLECHLERCGVEALTARRVRFIDCLVTEIHGASVDFRDSTWRDSHLAGGRLGALILAGATWKCVRVKGMKLGFVNLAGGRLEDVVFEGCEIGSLDLGAAHAQTLSLVDCTVAELNVAEATLAKVDLSGARLKSLVGIENLRGAIISHEQMIDLAPLLAAQLGVEVQPDPQPE
jgi:uncharacterized protein YjbI with pentapeptide repeats